MSNNIYGTVRQAQFDPSKDADVFYNYRPDRISDDIGTASFNKIQDASTVLEQSKTDNGAYGSMNLPGMYTLKLPVNIFNNTGIYTIYIVPKEIECEIADIGTLSSYPDIKGIIIDSSKVTGLTLGNDNVVGYSVCFFSNGNDREDYFRIVTTSTYCEPVTTNIVSTASSTGAYRYNQNGTYVFLTVTPSSAPSFKSNAKPFIGTPGQKIVLKNTKFDPVCIEVEITDHDIETVSYMLEGDQIRNYENGRITTYNFDGEIYSQKEYSTIKDDFTKTNIAEAKIDKSDNLDTSLSGVYDSIK